MTELEQKIVQVLWDYGIYEDDYAGAAELAKEIAGLMDATQIAKRMIEEYIQEDRTDKGLDGDLIWVEQIFHWLDKGGE